jgi:branched-chain amino acid transport system substrate-binding protein
VPGNVFYNGYMATRELLRAIERAGTTNNIAVIKQLEGHKMSAPTACSTSTRGSIPTPTRCSRRSTWPPPTQAEDEEDDMFKILATRRRKTFSTTDAPEACKLESYDDTPTFDAYAVTTPRAGSWPARTRSGHPVFRRRA